MEHLKQVLIALDQLANAILGGWADESLSARAYRLSKSSTGWGVVKSVIDALFFWEVGHCRAAYISEKNRTQLPPEYRKE